MRISFKMIKNCCINTTIRNLAILLKKLFIVSLPILIFSCSSAKKEEETIIKKKDTEINVDKRVREAADKNPLFSSSRSKRGGNFEFSTSNVLWRASLDSLDDIPLTTVDYSGGVILTDWYNISKSTNQTKDVKIQVRFLSNEVIASSIKITGHIKECASTTSCSVAKT
jgi:hypothetical protein